MKFQYFASGLLLLASSMAQAAGNAPASAPANAATGMPPLAAILSQTHECSPTLSLRTQAFSDAQKRDACALLGEIEQRFHRLFGTSGKAVKHDNNRSLRANIYASREEFEKYAGAHFSMPVDNGGMYLEGLPEQPNNQAEFVASQKKDGSVRNLGHEYVHYLDGRFNVYGDFCAALHDSHGAPENCPQPAPNTPYLVWWTEGLAEYLSKGDVYPEAVREAAKKTYSFSQLLETGYESNNGVERTYHWGYLAARFMLEKKREQIDTMLRFTREGDFARTQAVMRGWGNKFDGEFAQWLEKLALHAEK